MWPTIEALKATGGSGSIREIDDKVIEIGDFTEEQQAVLHGDGPQTELSYRLAWARTYLKAVGALENSQRGVWAITDEGRKLPPADVAEIPAKVRSLQRRRRRPGRAPDEPADGPSDEAGVEPADWKDQLLQLLQGLPPDAFERLSQRLLREAGFLRVAVTGRSGDGGIDGLGVLRMSLLSFPVFFQCKRYRGSVGPTVVRDFRGAMAGRGDKGLLITTGTFTREAENEARREGAPPIDLVDGDRLCDLLKQYHLGVQTEQIDRVAIDPGWFSEV
jgi:restriction system protein